MDIGDEELADALNTLMVGVEDVLSEAQALMAENLLVARAEPLAGGHAEAVAWYHSAKLAGFGDVTPAELARQGEAHAVLKYIQRVESGGYA